MGLLALAILPSDRLSKHIDGVKRVAVAGLLDQTDLKVSWFRKFVTVAVASRWEYFFHLLLDTSFPPTGLSASFPCRQASNDGS